MHVLDPVLRINGCDAAYAPQYGCDCPRCLSRAGVNTSASLIAHLDSGELFHTLFDCGRGVGQSLALEPLLRGSTALDWILLSHWHGDHTADLPLVLTGRWFTQTQREEEPSPVKLWAREGTMHWIDRDWPLLFPKGLLEKTQIEKSDSDPGVLLPSVELGLDDICVQPLTVSHATADKFCSDTSPAFASCCASFLIETPRSKTVLLWDIDQENKWLLDPRDANQRETVSALTEADTLIIDCENWGGSPHWKTCHHSFFQVCEIVSALRPRLTLLIHVSGHGDIGDGFGWPDQAWEEKAKEHWLYAGLPGAVGVATPGQILSL